MGEDEEGVKRTEWEENGADIEDNVCFGILGPRGGVSKWLGKGSRGVLQGANARVLDKATPQPNGSFDDHSTKHYGNSRDTELKDFLVRTRQSLNTLERNLAERRNHDDGEHQDTHRFQPFPSNWIAMLI